MLSRKDRRQTCSCFFPFLASFSSLVILGKLSSEINKRLAYTEPVRGQPRTKEWKHCVAASYCELKLQSFHCNFHLEDAAGANIHQDKLIFPSASSFSLRFWFLHFSFFSFFVSSFFPVCCKCNPPYLHGRMSAPPKPCLWLVGLTTWTKKEIVCCSLFACTFVVLFLEFMILRVCKKKIQSKQNMRCTYGSRQRHKQVTVFVLVGGLVVLCSLMMAWSLFTLY